ncbi:MAG: hypothetical protein JNG84_06805, partial [Archangium sp.]|nr:hypothetical protein [Archangium sp.]
MSRFASDFSDAAFPARAEVFRTTYGDALARFEAARLASPRRIDIARTMVTAANGAFQFRADDNAVVPLEQAMRGETKAPVLETKRFTGTPGLRVEIPLDGRTYRGLEALGAIDRLLADHHVTQAAHRALHWVVQHIQAAGGALDLSKHRFALLGAAAELAPTALLLSGGATILWVDVRSPADALRDTSALSGTVLFNPAKDDLLLNPAAALASVQRFAEDGPVHLGLFAYAPGAGRELRIAGAMDVLARTAKGLASVSMLVSPTSPGAVQPEDRTISDTRRTAPKAWQRGLQTVGALQRPGYVQANGVGVARAAMTIQGAAYQAAQYVPSNSAS